MGGEQVALATVPARNFNTSDSSFGRFDSEKVKVGSLAVTPYLTYSRRGVKRPSMSWWLLSHSVSYL